MNGKRFIQNLLRGLPFDASCIARDSEEAQCIRSFISHRRRQRLPRWNRAVVIPLLRLLWLFWCPVLALRVARQSSIPWLGSQWRSAVGKGWLYGQHPRLSLVPTRFLAGRDPIDVGHLDDCHWARLWSELGDRNDQALARDKRLLSERIAALGVCVPPLLMEFPKATPVRLETLPWTHVDTVFIKPRTGARAVGANSVQQLSHGLYRINGNEVVTHGNLEHRLNRLAHHDSLLVQPFLRAAATTRDLSDSSPVELRITTARHPKGEAFVLACFVKIQPPGVHSATVLTGALAVPINPRTGEMATGMLLNQPDRRHAVVPWNGARIAGRRIPRYEELVRTIVTASRALPNLPVIGWDVLLDETGPTVLEANTSLSWRLIHLWNTLTRTASPLAGIVLEWIATQNAQHETDSKVC